VELAEAEVGDAHVQETAAAVVEADGAAGAGGGSEQGVLGGAETRGEMVQQQQLIVALATQAQQQRQQPADRGRREQAQWRVELVLVRYPEVVQAVQPFEGRRAGRRGEHVDGGGGPGFAESAQGGRGGQRISKVRQLDDEQLAYG